MMECDSNREQNSREVLNGRYYVRSVLGTGTYGEVLRCYDMRRGREVAVKVARQEDAYRRCAITEAEALRKLMDCSAVCRIYDTFEQNQRIHIVSELLRMTLFEFMQAKNFCVTPLDEVRELARALIRAVVRVHEVGYMHCDIKPENVMLKEDLNLANACLIDFGAVRKEHENNYFDIQSLWYRAPEVICGVPYTTQIDSWSVGCLLYELHVGKPLFSADGAKEQLMQIISMFGMPSARAMTSGKYSTQYLPVMRTVRRIHGFRLSEKFKGSFQDVEQFSDLLHRLLEPDENQRLSLSDALSHPFLSKMTLSDSMCSTSGLTSAGGSPSVSVTSHKSSAHRSVISFEDMDDEYYDYGDSSSLHLGLGSRCPMPIDF